MDAPGKPTCFCNACGREILLARAMGGRFLGFRVCSSECAREIRWRETLSIMKKDYYPDPEPYKGESYPEPYKEEG